ncbi:transcriptional regulator [Megasphaera cerevisiae DSM 20462]|jgi:DNA-binding GntR family transcriptional regulator|uniref:Transcriptional regulator n=1 Tax=Megasphaera cerevisiae DSM 20462 TaxID=1122219 RepID=A0A0J6WW37_9FIRM|nr:GntR family transcriptional regulator [Megasphaera cerevisiae]KMO87745.1 transcriptional regulator [Megasphaera cerevisiae DSM 20462]OKY53327.1 transcriptional regulator [Megasphaera cerevisiae]SJZ63759.1 DNA-binding transcriptional regulator, GntR family [Megasphaera cerevisiae DSM 20462]
MDGLVLLEKENRETVREYAYRVLYQNIMRLHLLPGMAMSEQVFSTVLSVSRTPVREAFIRLSQKGLLDVLPQRGTFVSKIDTEQISEFRFLRVTLEKAIIALACEEFQDPWKEQLRQCLKEQELFVGNEDVDRFFKSDNEMHRILYEGCSKLHVWQIIQDSNLDYLRARMLNITAAREQMHILYSQHQAILEAILQHDTRRGVEVITDHINKVIGDVATLKKQYPTYFK